MADMNTTRDPHDLTSQPVPGGTGCWFGAEVKRDGEDYVIEVLDDDFAFLEMASAPTYAELVAEAQAVAGRWARAQRDPEVQSTPRQG